MPTLYRQYRPQKFGEVYGQSHITDTLQRAISTERLAHAYLFHGPRGTGKTTTARILAKRLNCLKPNEAEPCGTCSNCQATQENRHLDIIEIDAASNRGIDDIRALKDAINLRPTLGKYKVYIIDEVHMLSREAFAALLKTLEEPVKHAVFILATTEFHKVPATILSRCQVYRFRRATRDEMTARLTHLLKQEKREASPASLDFIIHRSDGCYRDAESLLGQVLTLKEGSIEVDDLTEFLGLPPRDMINNFLKALIAGDSAGAVAAVDEAFARGLDPEQFLKESIVAARDGALSLIKNEPFDFEFVKLPAAAAKLPAIIRALLQAVQDLAYVPQPLIALHLAIVSLTQTKAAAPVSSSSPSPLQGEGRGEVAGPAGSNLAPSPQPTPRVTPAAAMSFTPPPPPPKTAMSLPGSTGQSRSSSPSPLQGEGRGEVAAPSPSPSAGAIPLVQVKKIWPELINAVKATNPVASTFLRALEPVAVEGNVIRVQAYYALHRNFFDKPENRGPLEQIVNQLLKQTGLEIRCFMTEAGPAANITIQQRQRQQEDALFAAVQEAFSQTK